ncbi:MAG: AMP-binding protein, partial [Paracoccaceae bacterium]
LPSLRALVQISNTPISGAFSFDEVVKKGTAGYLARLDHISSGLLPDEAINIQFTSGTTGAPKGATLSHKNIINNAVSCAKAMKFTHHDRLCIPVPLYHCFGMVLGTLACCSAGAAMIFPSEGFEADKTVRALKDERCTAVHGVPTMFSAMLSSPEYHGKPIKSLRTGIMAGSQCPETLMRRVLYDLGCSEITIGYGMTETSPISFQSDVNDPVNVRVSTVGRIQPHCEVKIVDDDGNTCAVGETGEFWARGYLVMKGYWQDEAATRASIEGGWMKSGDLATIDAQGYCRIVGRKKDMVIRGGENIYPAELEDFLTSQKGIREAHVFGIPDEKFGEQLVAWIVAKKGANIDETSIKELCRKSLAYYKVPAIVRFVDEVPLTATGKPQKFRMREMMMSETTAS